MLTFLKNSYKNFRCPLEISLCVLIAVLPLAGCDSSGSKAGQSPYRTRLSALFDDDFVGLQLPGGDVIKAGAVSHVFPEITIGEVWNSSLFVLAQRGVIARASRADGVIICVVDFPKGARFLHDGYPNVLLVEQAPESRDVIVYANWLGELFQQNDKSGTQLLSIQRDVKQKLSEGFFEKLATEVYAKHKWKYLAN